MPEPPLDSAPSRTLEMAHILFMDIVAYSRLPMDEQHEVLNHLQEAVRETKEYARGQSGDQLTRLPTGDGMALVFFGDVEAPVRCALELHRILLQWPEIQLRMGIHTGPVYRVEDINDARNVAGGGINIAQRVMDCGDAGHILISKSVADVLDQVSTWKMALCDLGEIEVKHGVRIHLYNLCSQEAGNRKLPQKLQAAQTMAANARARAKIKRMSLVAAAAVGAIAVIVTALFLWQSRHPQTSHVDAASPKAIAVLPFQNAGSDKETDFLRLALPDEVANTLSYVQSFSIRPFATTSKYSGPNVDLQKAGREMGVTSIVTGHYLTEHDQLEVTLEAVDVANNRSIWRDTISVPASDRIAMRGQVTSRVRQGLVPMLRGSPASGESGTRPMSEEAYDLYLRSTGMPDSAAANKRAVTMLEHAVSIDPSYAPVWEALGRRYYFDAIYSDGGAAGYKRSIAAYQRALALEPGRVSSAGFLAMIGVESGNLDEAYQEARALVQKRPDNAIAHYSLAYVLRYAGRLEEAQSECDKALAIDPKNYNWRSCSLAFFEQGKLSRAMDYLNLDAGSEWSNANRVSLLMREGKMPEARLAAQQMTENPMWMRGLLEACLNKAPATEVHRLAEQAENELLQETDSELKYLQGAILAACGEKQIAYAFLRKSVEQNYCAYTALQTDLLLVKLRGTPEFSELLSAARECQNRFLAQRDQSPH